MNVRWPLSDLYSPDSIDYFQEDNDVLMDLNMYFSKIAHPYGGEDEYYRLIMERMYGMHWDTFLYDFIVRFGYYSIGVEEAMGVNLGWTRNVESLILDNPQGCNLELDSFMSIAFDSGSGDFMVRFNNVKCADAGEVCLPIRYNFSELFLLAQQYAICKSITGFCD